MDSQSWSSKCFLKNKFVFHFFGGKQEGKNSLEVIWEIKRSSLCSQPQNNIFITYVGLCPYWWGYVCPFYAWGMANLFIFRLYGLGWYKVRSETPQEGFFIFLAWSVGWGGEWGEGVFLAWYGVGDSEISISFTPNSYFWKTSPNSKKHKIGQNWKISFY